MKNGAVMDSQNPTQALEKATATPAVITTPDEYRSSLQKWNAQAFHVLTPAANFSGLPPQYGMVAALVQINPDPNGGEVYRDPLFCDGDEVAIAKIGLSKIAQAAGMTIKTERTDPRTIPHYWEVRATARFMGLDGRPQEIDATVEYDLRDDSPRVQKLKKAAAKKGRDASNQIEGARMYGLRGAEARAINAAIRQFGVRQKYTAAELKKPFVTLRVMFQPDMTDPETRRLVTERALQGTTALYSSAGRAIGPAQHLDTIGATDPPSESPRRVGSSSTAPAGSSQPSTPATPASDPDRPPADYAVRIVDVTSKSGEKNGRAWTRYSIVDSQGVEHSTFDKKIADFAEKAKAAKQWVEIAVESDGQYKNLIEILPFGEQPSLLPDGDKL